MIVYLTQHPEQIGELSSLFYEGSVKAAGKGD